MKHFAGLFVVLGLLLAPICASAADQVPLKQTGTPAHPTTFAASDTVGAPHGGLGVTTITAHCVVIGQGASPVHLVCPSASGQVLTDNGASTDPSFQVFTTLISSVTTSGSQASVTFSSIPGTYKHLELFVWGRTLAAAFNDDIWLQFNSDTGNNYSRQYITSSGTATPAAGQDNSVSHMAMFSISGASATANFAGAGEATIFGYSSTSFNKEVRTSGGFANGMSSGNLGVAPIFGVWNNTAAITSIKVYTSSGSGFVNGSVVSLYGLP